MRVNDREEATVHTMNPVHGQGPVFYASFRRDTETPEGRGTNREEARHRLVSTLWEHLEDMESPLWKRRQSSYRSALQIQVTRGLLGRPYLLLGENRGPAISFSDGKEKVWAALCGDESDIGIDVAGTDEFRTGYPLHRVFHPQELRHALRLADGDLGNASALLWSVKEAVVKALGCAFHLVDPRQITIYPSQEGEAEGIAGYTLQAVLSEKALMRLPSVRRRSLWVRSLPQGKMWLSVALLNRRPSDRE